MKKNKLSLFLIAGIGLLLSCAENELTPPVDSVTDQQVPQWSDLLQTLDLESNIVLVEKDGSIQEAIDAASPGDAIYIESGVYKEALKIDKQNIHIIGVSNDENEKVILENPGNAEIGLDIAVSQKSVEIYNIELRDFRIPGATIYPLEKKQLKKGSCLLLMNREDLGGGIAHYEFEVKMGTGEFDMVRIHRVVMEHRPYRPIRTKGDVFMVHGGIQDFEDIFLIYGTETINEETSAPYFLASNKIDVWGIDLGWNLVPMETTDFEFMKDWGLEKDLHHTLKAMSIARLIRGLTKQGFCKLNLLGFSYGVSVAYSAAGFETQLFQMFRNIKGIIPVDAHYKYKPGSYIDNFTCDQADGVLAEIDAGKLESTDALIFMNFGNLALTAPDDPTPYSDMFGNLNNMQVLMAIGSSHNGYHFHGGTPFEFFYTDSMRLARVSVNLGPYMPNRAQYEHFACGCSSKEVSFDDNLEEISLPVFFITSEGCEGAYIDYTKTLIQSTEYQYLNINDPDKNTDQDFGHGDLWSADMAAEWVWEPLRQWLIAH